MHLLLPHLTSPLSLTFSLFLESSSNHHPRELLRISRAANSLNAFFQASLLSFCSLAVPPPPLYHPVSPSLSLVYDNMQTDHKRNCSQQLAAARPSTIFVIIASCKCQIAYTQRGTCCSACGFFFFHINLDIVLHANTFRFVTQHLHLLFNSQSLLLLL